jgi:ATP-dependent helicase/nuclease subunit A
MSGIGHVMILASAGSGKTYALTNRYVRLLAHGAKPERIAALTFTRKAAGEFFDEILKKLARAAEDEKAARRLAQEIEVPSLQAADFLKLLRSVTASMHRLNLGTLDSFFARVVKAFPLELGLGADFEVLQEYSARMERRRVLRRMFAHADGDTARQDFIEAFKRATFGTEEKRLGARLDAFLDEHAEVYLAAPDKACWGRAERIWPEGNAWLGAADPGKRRGAAAALQGALPWGVMKEKQRERWEAFFGALPDWAPGAPLPKPLAYVLGNALKAWPELTEITIERTKLPLPAEASRALRDLSSGIVGAELARRLEMTQGVYAVLHGYEQVYDEMVRRTGRLTFADVQRLLRPDEPNGARRLSREETDEARLFIDWRLDAQIDHWLLDEFQDTSYGQWSVLRNLIDEAVQDPTGSRSFFYVGDVKQAIFAWREGDSRLFREIFDHYNNAQADTIREQRLDRSWRSGPAVIAMVNRVFGDAESLARLFPDLAAQRWSAEWRDHESARTDLNSFATLRHAEGREGRFAETRKILEETRPLERGLSVAVLVQKNSTAAEMADFLRREGNLPAVAESDLHIGTDNPLTSAVLAMLRVAAHPGDKAALAHVAMTPVQELLNAEGIATPDGLTARLLGEIHADGFERTLARWLSRLETFLETQDTFSRERSRQLVDAARLFDETGGRVVAEFLQFIERHTVRDSDAAAVVRVLTVHKAKGLGFDLVILPDLEGTKLAARRRGLAVQRARDRSVEWILDLPPEAFYGEDPVLASHVAQAEADACYEELAVLYVAMTRAKRAMYLVTEPLGTSQSRNFPRLLQETLGDTWSAGDGDWFETVGSVATREEPKELPSVRGPKPAVRRLIRTPSATKQAEVAGARLFSLVSNDAVRFGREVHRLLAQVEWLDRPGSGPVWTDCSEAGQEASACLQSSELAEVWMKPASAGASVWRERAFEVVLDGVWISGVFDRVVIFLDARQRPERAVVYDFKTDRNVPTDLSDAADRHSEQIELYRQVLAVLTGLAMDKIDAEVVLTGLGRKVRVGKHS